MVDVIAGNYATNVNSLQKMNAQNNAVTFNAQEQYQTDNQLERMPQYDTYQQENSGGGSVLKPIIFGALGITGLLTAIDFIFCKGKHVKKIVGWEEKAPKAPNADPKDVGNIKPPDPKNNITAGLPPATANTPLPKTFGQKIAGFFTESIPGFFKNIWGFLTKPFRKKTPPPPPTPPTPPTP